MKIIACKNRLTGLWDWFCPRCLDSVSGYPTHTLAIACAAAHGETRH